MDSLWMILAGTAVGGAAMLGVYNLGQREALAKLEAQGLTTYIEVMEAIKNENIDLSDDAAVTAELCRLAGLEPDDPQCSGL